MEYSVYSIHFFFAAYVAIDYYDNYEKFLIIKSDCEELESIIGNKNVNLIININGELRKFWSDNETIKNKTKTYVTTTLNFQYCNSTRLVQIYDFKRWNELNQKPDVKEFLKLWKIVRNHDSTAPIIISCR